MPDDLTAYGVTVTRTLKMIGRFRSPESAREFVLGLADSGQLAVSDWEEVVTVEPLAPTSPAPGEPEAQANTQQREDDSASRMERAAILARLVAYDSHRSSIVRALEFCQTALRHEEGSEGFGETLEALRAAPGEESGDAR